MKLQLYENFRQKTPSGNVTLPELADLISTDEQLKAATMTYRQLMLAGREKEAKAVKEQTPQVAVHFTMAAEGRSEKECLQATGYVLIDFDAKGSEALPQSELERVITILRTSYHTALGYRSLSGQGYHILVQYVLPEGVAIDLQKDPKRGKEIFTRAYRFIAQMFTVYCGHGMDMQCGNMNRFCGLAHDPEVCLRQDVRPVYLTHRDLGIGEDGKFIKPASRQTRFNADGTQVSIPLGSHLANAEQYLEHPRGGGSALSFTVGHRHEYIMRLAFMLNRMGIDEEEAAKALDDKYGKGWDEKPSKILHSVYKCAAHEHGISLKARDSKVQRISTFLQKQPLRFDSIKRKTNIQGDDASWRETTDRDLNDLYVSCCNDLGEDISLQLFRPILNSSVVPAVNPLREYLDQLPPWTPDMPDYIAQVAAMVHTSPQQLWLTCFRKWFVAMVAAWMDDEVVNHQVLVLIGRQGIYKTTFLDKIMPPQLCNFRCKQSNTERLDKDEVLRSAEYGLINLDEIDKLSDRGLNELKALITNTQIDVRAAYGYSKEKRIRIASYVASGNKDQFLSDMTGNRRWLPFHVESIDDPWHHDFPYSGMYAQALYLISTGFNYWFSLDDIEQMEHHTREFMTITREEDLLDVYFAPATGGNGQLLTTSEILAKLKAYGNIARETSLRNMGIILRKHGYEQVHRKNGRFWKVRELSNMELTYNRTDIATHTD